MCTPASAVLFQFCLGDFCVVCRFIIGTGNNSSISLPKNKGVRITVIEERENRLNKDVSADKKKTAA